VQIFSGELIYEGELMGAEPDGEGTETLPNGDKYTGEFLNGKRYARFCAEIPVHHHVITLLPI
jgi:hypothetical protein